MKGIELCADCAYYNMKSHKCTRGCKIDPDTKKGDDIHFFVDCLLPDVQPVKQWISVDDKLPIEHGPVLCYARSTTGEGNFRILGTLRNGEFWFLQVDGTQFSFPNLCLEVTHWMPLPEPPKEE